MLHYLQTNIFAVEQSIRCLFYRAWHEQSVPDLLLPAVEVPLVAAYIRQGEDGVCGDVGRIH